MSLAGVCFANRQPPTTKDAKAAISAAGFADANRQPPTTATLTHDFDGRREPKRGVNLGARKNPVRKGEPHRAYTVGRVDRPVL